MVSQKGSTVKPTAYLLLAINNSLKQVILKPARRGVGALVAALALAAATRSPTFRLEARS